MKNFFVVVTNCFLMISIDIDYLKRVEICKSCQPKRKTDYQNQKFNWSFWAKNCRPFLIKFFKHSEWKLVVLFVASTPALQLMQIKAPDPRKLLGSGAPAPHSSVLLLQVSQRPIPSLLGGISK